MKALFASLLALCAGLLFAGTSGAAALDQRLASLALDIAPPGAAARDQRPESAGPFAVDAPGGVALQQRLGSAVPLDVAVVDEAGQPSRLRDRFRTGEPVLLVLGYYRCPQLCGLVMHSLLEGLQGTALPPQRWRVVALSIDPQDQPADAQRRRARDLAFAATLGPRPGEWVPRLDLLVADAADVKRIAAAIGFDARPAPAGGFAHPATVALLTPDGRVARYFNGIGIDAVELRTALLAAAEGRIGTPTDRLALLCADVQAALGRNGAVLWALRALAAGCVAALAAFVWHQGRPGART